MRTGTVENATGLLLEKKIIFIYNNLHAYTADDTHAVRYKLIIFFKRYFVFIIFK